MVENIPLAPSMNLLVNRTKRRYIIVLNVKRRLTNYIGDSIEKASRRLYLREHRQLQKAKNETR